MTNDSKTKKCTKCGEELPESKFHKNCKAKDGLHHQCKSCQNETTRKYYQANIKEIRQKRKEYYENNREQINECNREYNANHRKANRERNKRWYQANREEKLQKEKEYYENNREKIRQRHKEYNENNKEYLNKKNKKWYQDNKKRAIKYRVEYNKRQRQNNIQFRLAHNLRSRLYKAINNGQKSGSAVSDLGCTIEELKIHLESQFEEGMTWDNWAHDGWHIDHIKPLHMFDLTDREQFLEACHYTNLRPLWAKDNMSRTYEEFEDGN
jgi:hypothetical protein